MPVYFKPGTALASYLANEEAAGKKTGDIKLRFLDGGFGWNEVFEGEFIALKEEL